MILHGFFRSTASWRVRIAMNLKNVAHSGTYYQLRRGDHLTPQYRRTNPQQLVPSLELDDGPVLTQSLAICEYLEDLYPDPPLLPREPFERAQVRGFAMVIACDIHPIQNLKILQRLRDYGLDEEQSNAWARQTITEGLAACDALIADRSDAPYCFGDTPSLADICLIPQLANARRFGVDLRWPKLLAIEEQCRQLPAFEASAPDCQPDRG